MNPRIPLHRVLTGALVVGVGLAGPAGAQSDPHAALIGAPTYTTYVIGAGATQRTITQSTMPFVALLGLSERFSMDVSTAFASSSASGAGTPTSSITGLTDTQLRGNLGLGDNMLVTFGLNLPTGRYQIPEAEQEAAGQIGNDFLNYAISSMGSGLGLTGGLAYARPIGDWNLGLGGSVRKATEFAAFSVDSTDFRFTPADEVRVRLGLDRPLGDGQVEFGLSFSSFGKDIADTTAVSTGDRLTLTSSMYFPVRGVDVFVSVWDLVRFAGQQVGGVAPPENVFNFNTGLSFEWGRLLVQPNLETRLWMVDGTKAGNLVNVGVRGRVGIGSLGVYPSVGFSTGTLFSTTDGSETPLTGFRGSLTVRWN